MQRKEKIILPVTIFITIFAILEGRLFIPIVWLYGPWAPFVGITLEGLEYALQGGMSVVDVKFDMSLSILIIVIAIGAWIGVPILTFLITKGISWKRRIVYMYFIISSSSIISGYLIFRAINFFT